MKHSLTLLVLVTALTFAANSSSFGRGFGGGGGGGHGGGGGGGFGGGGFGGGGGGGSRDFGGGGGAGRSPSFGGGGSQFGGGGFGGGGEFGGGGRGGFEGAGGAGREGAGGSGRPGGEGFGGGGGRPSSSQLNSFLDIPGGGGAGRNDGGASGEFMRGGSSNTNAAAFGQRNTNVAAGGERNTNVVAGGERNTNVVAGGERNTNVVAGGEKNTNVVVGGSRTTNVVAGGGNVAATRPVAGVAPGTRQAFAQNSAARVQDRQGWQDNRQNRYQEVRNQVAGNYPRMDFWHDHPNWAQYHINHPYHPVAWASLATWVGAGAAAPVAYDYGDNVYYEGDNVYYGTQPAATASDYNQQAATLADSAPETDPAKSEWLALGVFALTQDGQATGSTPSNYMQLAVNKEGAIAGTFKNMNDGAVQDMEGMIDKKSQRAAWGVKGKKSPIIETGLANFTKDSAPCLMHFADGSTQQWLMVRLPPPKDDAGAAQP